MGCACGLAVPRTAGHDCGRDRRQRPSEEQPFLLTRCIHLQKGLILPPGALNYTYCPWSDIRMVSRQILLGMPETRGHQQIQDSVPVLELTFASQERAATLGRMSNPPALRPRPDKLAPASGFGDLFV